MDTKKTITEKENFALVLSGQQPAWLPNWLDAAAMVRSLAVGRKRDPKTGYHVDIFGVEFETTADGDVPAYSKTHRVRLDDIREWKTVMPEVALNQIDWEADANALRKEFVKEGQMCSLTVGWIFEELHYMMGTEGAMEALLLEPEAAYACMDAMADFWIDVMRRLYPYLKPESIMMMNHLATHKGLLISPRTYREMIAPIDAKFVAAVRDLGAIAQIHCDGYIEDILPDFCAMGVQMLQPFQIYNDINAAKDQYGLIAVGGWDAFGRGNQQDSSEEEIRASVRQAMDAYGPGGRYVFWQSGVTPSYAYHQDILANEARRYGAEFYAK